MSKKRKDVLNPLSDVLQRVLGSGKSPLSDGFLRWKIWRFWRDIVGPTLGAACEPVGYERGRLLVWVKSSARLQEIRFFEKTLREKVNAHVGSEWVQRIHFTLDRRGIPTASDMPDAVKKYLED